MNVSFSEIVVVVELPRLRKEETDGLFWTVEDYQRMRIEHQTQQTRKARVRIREMKRRMVARIQQRLVVENDDDETNAKTLHTGQEFPHADTVRLNVESQPIKNPRTAFAA